MTDLSTSADWKALLRGVCLTPDADLPRLVAADWLEENGHGVRAAFVRHQIELAGMGLPRGSCPPGCPCEGRGDWLGPGFPPADVVTRVKWLRGFPGEVSLTLAAFLEHAPALFAAAPLAADEPSALSPFAAVDLTDRVPLFSAEGWQWGRAAGGCNEVTRHVLPAPCSTCSRCRPGRTTSTCWRGGRGPCSGTAGRPRCST